MKKIKILAIISLIVASLIIFAGCTSSPELEERQNSSNNYFITIQDCNTYRIVYDPNTKVMYTMSWKGIATMLTNVDGKPLLYDK